MFDAQTVNKEDLFKLALGLQDPWYVKEISFSHELGKLDIYLAAKINAKFSCSNCGQELSAYDTTKRTWRHLNFFQYEAHIHADLPRIQCFKCQTTKNVSVPWARPNSGFTLLFEAFTMELAQSMPLTTAGKIINEYANRIMRIIEYYVSQARTKVDMSQVKAINTDETSTTKGHNYITVFIDPLVKRVLFATPGKDNTTVIRFKTCLEKHGGKAENIQQACSDLSKAFIKGITEQLPNAKIIFDRYHVMLQVNTALDEVRKEEVLKNAILKGSRYAWLHNPDTATDKQTEQLAKLTTLNLKTVRAYQIRLALKDIYDMMIDKEQAEVMLQKWYFWATHSRIKPIIKAAKMIKQHWAGILSFFDNRITNGIAEGYNSIIQTIKRRARGYRNIDNFITMIYLVLGKLKFNLPRVSGLTH
ncbi:MAG: ISL3 family transposase [Candidatus Daviesbacteria bacterium]|nr:ISL3 family transposase [Candidatus Daviesbacteria bacterium]